MSESPLQVTGKLLFLGAIVYIGADIAVSAFKRMRKSTETEVSRSR